MHIPDGYLSPQTYVPAYGIMIPLWWRASARLKATLRNRQVPILALGAAFSFIIMMFNIPIPGGTTGHAVGGVLVAILLGPWAAMVAVTLALVVQALMFGDGGVTALGANCLNMAVVMPFAGWAVYRLIAHSAPVDSRRRWIAAAVGGYVGLNASALSTALMFGIQPLIAHDAAGRALYCPFGLKVAVPIMCGEHLLVFGFVEAIVTGLAIAYLQRVEPSLLPEAVAAENPLSKAGSARVGSKGFIRRLAIGIGALVVLSPLGLYLPARFAAGSAWGEWSSTAVTKLVGYTPAGLGHLEHTWKAPVPDYALPGRTSAAGESIIYTLAAAGGIALVILLAYALKRLVWRRRDEASPAVDAPVNHI